MLFFFRCSPAMLSIKIKGLGDRPRILGAFWFPIPAVACFVSLTVMATAVYSSCLILLSLLILSLPRAFAATVTYDFDVSWLQANPDGAALRPVIGINGQWPIPPISATKGDRVIVNVKNLLGNESTSLHFHGLYMNGSNHMDGPVGTTQCPIPPGASFTYNFTVSSYFYSAMSKGLHSHPE